MKKHLHIVVNEKGEFFAHSLAYFRALAIRRFLTANDYGYGGSWPDWERKGFEVRKCRVELVKKSELMGNPGGASCTP